MEKMVQNSSRDAHTAKEKSSESLRKQCNLHKERRRREVSRRRRRCKQLNSEFRACLPAECALISMDRYATRRRCYLTAPYTYIFYLALTAAFVREDCLARIVIVKLINATTNIDLHQRDNSIPRRKRRIRGTRGEWTNGGFSGRQDGSPRSFLRHRLN